MRWRSFVAVGDSFTEGMNDAYPDGSYRGWADLVATRLAAEAGPDFGYANLAIRGRLFPGVVAEQVPAALAMKPDLVSFAAGGNDVLRRTCDVLAAGGTPTPGASVVAITRQGGDGRLATIRYSLVDIKAGKAPDPLLQPDDRVEVQR